MALNRQTALRNSMHLHTACLRTRWNPDFLTSFKTLTDLPDLPSQRCQHHPITSSTSCARIMDGRIPAVQGLQMISITVPCRSTCRTMYSCKNLSDTFEEIGSICDTPCSTDLNVGPFTAVPAGRQVPGGLSSLEHLRSIRALLVDKSPSRVQAEAYPSSSVEVFFFFDACLGS